MCKCGCGSCNVDSELIAKLEQLFTAMNAKYIFVNSHWYGNEMTGENYIQTFANVGEPIYSDTSHKINITVSIDGNKTKEIDIDF